MIVSEKVQAILIAAPAIADLVPATCIKMPGAWQNLARPYIIHFPVAADPTQVYGGRAKLTDWPFYQVSIFADSCSSGEAVAIAVRDALEGLHDDVRIFWRGGPWYVGRDDPTGVEHFALDFRIFEAL